MSEEYDDVTALHYAAFRPSLHLPILSRCLQNDVKFALGLDVGCGTGQSSIALTNFCEKVIGIEPSSEMLIKAEQHPKITYLECDGEHLEFEDDYFDVITFAGSLYYAKSQKLLDEVLRVGKEGCLIVVYDFEIKLDNVLSKLKTKTKESEGQAYDHSVNFSGLKGPQLRKKESVKDQEQLQFTSNELAHLLLSSKENFGLLSGQLGKEGLYSILVEKLHCISMKKYHKAWADIYYTNYYIIK